jgi:branched-chain amino acid transport system ATP-binding protein
MLELRDVHAGYAEIPVLRGVSLVVPPGKVAALLGRNGAGKTTLLRVASGLHPITSGELTLDGRDASSWPAERFVQEGVCHIPEGRGIFGSLTVRENLVLFAESGREAAVLGGVLDRFPNLERHLDQPAGTLSGGQQQMVALARAFTRSFDFVVIDEASLGLAPIVVEEIFGVIRALANEGAGLLLVDQYVSQVLQFADLVYLLHRGSVVFAGEPAELEGEDLFLQYMA